MATKTFATANEDYRKLMANGVRYRVPRFQRDYSWTEENWEDLWLDILEIIDDEDSSSHYMGYLVLQAKGESRDIDVIDGQQRLTTISIIVLAALRVLQKIIDDRISVEDNERRLEEIRRTYIGQVDSVSLQVKPKLSLNRNNDSYFQTYLATLRALPQRNLKASVHLLRKASDWFERRLNDLFNKKQPNRAEQGALIASLIERMSDRLFFTVITVADELNAYKVFETLNARGVKLAAPDLLKNYLFSAVAKDSTAQDDGELDALEMRWSEILNRLASENITTFLRTFWGARYAFVREAELFKTIKKNVGGREEAYDLLKGLEDDVELYLALSSPETSDLGPDDKKNAILLKLFSVRQPFALLMSVQRKLPGDFTRLLNAIVNISFRYNVIGSLQAAEQERTYSRTATAVAKGEMASFDEIVMSLKSIYPNDEIFEATFSSKEFDTSNTRNRNVVKYLLAKIEGQKYGANSSSSFDGFTIEHILPENAASDWTEFTDSEVQNMSSRLGNMTLLEDSLNRTAGRKRFVEKQQIFANSAARSTRELPADFQDWTPESIEVRQKTMARLAKTIWRVELLG